MDLESTPHREVKLYALELFIITIIWLATLLDEDLLDDNTRIYIYISGLLYPIIIFLWGISFIVKAFGGSHGF